MTEFIKDKIQVASKADVLKLHLLVKCFQSGITLSEADVNSLVELYEVGYSPQYFISCVQKGYYKSEQTVRNAVARMTNLGILRYKKRGQRDINPDYLPHTHSDKVMIQYLVANL